MEIDSESNITVQELFYFEIDRSIETGDINIIKNALIEYKNFLDISHHNLANKIIFQLTEEKLDDLSIKN